MESDSVKILISKFSEDLVDYVFKDRGYFPFPLRSYPDNSPATHFEESVGIFVIALIKGELKTDVEKTIPLLLGGRKQNELHDVITNYRDFLFRNNQYDFMTIMKVIALTIMFPFSFYKQNRRRASLSAVEEVNDLLKSLSDGQFVLTGGLFNLSNFSRNMLKTNPELLTIYTEGTYPC